jgi:chemotaxis protein methyltransferase CheR
MALFVEGDIMNDEELEKTEISMLLEGIYHRYGYDFRNYAYSSIKRRIWHRIHCEKLNRISQLLEKVLHDPACLKRLLEDFSINVTEMFRDPSFFLSFRKNVVPILKTYPFVRIWHAGCSTGEEVYSMAILLKEEGLYDKSRIYATDINHEVLSVAKAGIYAMERMKLYTKNYHKAGGTQDFSQYYTAKYNAVKFHSYLQKNIVFAQHNLVTDQSFNEFNVIICRNVMIYFDKLLQNRVHALFYDSLSHFGILGLGNKETMAFTEYADSYEVVDLREKIYRRIM